MIPLLKIDIFALLIFLGTVQGLFLSIFFLSKPNRQFRANLFLGFFLIAVSLLSLDILLSYTNLMFKIIYLVDSTEPLNFLLGPLIYLYISAKLDEKTIRKVYYHFIPSVFYLIYVLIFQVRTYTARFNAHIAAYHPEMEFLSQQGPLSSDPLYLNSFINELTILSMTVYTLLAVYKIYSSQKSEQLDQNRKKLYSLLWFDVIMFGCILLIVIIVKLNYRNDLGDYIIITAVALFIYSLSFKIVRESLFFQKAQYERKYAKSALDDSKKVLVLEKLKSIMETEKYFLQANATLPDLAKKTNCTPNHLSQIINENLQQTFPELLAEYRVQEAKKILLDPKMVAETIESIAFQIGYNSKSTFNKVFKKKTGITPSEFRNSTPK
ncbi:MAG: AraC family transcriptional regulator [Calditrichaeota bacterium]|nr:MAG: AraC family transcriptional regulator [Calditrichota bacterium]